VDSKPPPGDSAGGPVARPTAGPPLGTPRGGKKEKNAVAPVAAPQKTLQGQQGPTWRQQGPPWQLFTPCERFSRDRRGPDHSGDPSVPREAPTLHGQQAPPGDSRTPLPPPDTSEDETQADETANETADGEEPSADGVSDETSGETAACEAQLTEPPTKLARPLQAAAGLPWLVGGVHGSPHVLAAAYDLLSPRPIRSTATS